MITFVDLACLNISLARVCGLCGKRKVFNFFPPFCFSALLFWSNPQKWIMFLLPYLSLMNLWELKDKLAPEYWAKARKSNG